MELYFRLVTIATLGYGDISPATTLAEILSILEAAIGQPYLLITLTRLAGMHISQTN